MKQKFFSLQLFTAIVLSFLVLSCATQTKVKQQSITSLSKEIKEISPGILEGYLCSYPSGHKAIGWAWALILAEVFPGQADVILERGKEFGISRNVCNVHWHSDVVYGRMMGATAVAVLHSNADFISDLKAAKEENRTLTN